MLLDPVFSRRLSPGMLKYCKEKYPEIAYN
jgi:hypothetical protein